MKKKYVYACMVAVIVIIVFIGYKNNGQAEVLANQNAVATNSNTNTIEDTDTLIAEHKEIDDEKLAELKEAEEIKVNKQKKLDELKAKVEEFIKDNKDNVGIAYYDLNSSLGFSINGDKTFKAASTVKVPISMATVDLIKENKLTMDQGVIYSSQDYEDGAGILQGTSRLRKPIDINTLIDYSIKYSDNIAVNMLLRTITPEYKYSYIENIVKHTVNRAENESSALDSLEILKKLYFNNDNNAYYKRIIDDMKDTIYHDRIDKYIPQEIVAHKIGDYEDYVNDIGIIYADEPYILTVFTKNTNGNPNELIAKLSKYIYENR
ncbi:serine hydrolase [Clostridium zeae]|uniref:Serine hydrolase n=1 Tax=Clostridium zeae TaxID=2759022 RepID=A0ABQ1E8B1_9CLOT|nr:serine hydrolase [Clostridium zeae]GFZ31027.1 serine hydrolase [Clostridium zeae]